MSRSLVFGIVAAGMVIAANVQAESEIKFSGDVQYQFKINLNGLKGADGKVIESESKKEYQHWYGWNIKASIKATDNLSLGFRLTNPIENYDNSQLWDFGSGAYTAMPEAYFKVKTGIFSFSGGRIPQSSLAALDLLAFENSKYNRVVSNSWDYLANSSIQGTNIGLDLLKNDNASISLSITNALYSGTFNVKDDFILKTSFLHLLVVPVKTGFIELNPHFYLHRNINYMEVQTYNVDPVMAIGAGLDAAIKPVTLLDIRLCGGFSAYDKSEAHKDATVLTGGKEAPIGILLGAEARVKPGFGTARLGYKMNMNHDREDESDGGDPVKHLGMCLDARYEMTVKSLGITPRLRFWSYSNSVNDSKTTRLRPELIFSAKF